MHPNWKALATLHIPLKRFVTEGSTEVPPSSLVKKKHQIANVTATEVTEFYHDVISTPETTVKPPTPPPPATATNQQQRPSIPFDKNKFFRAAMANDSDTIYQFNFHGNDINATDSFGWTALMMAACEGAADAVETLVQLGADTTFQDRSGNSASSLAEKKHFYNILDLLSRPEMEEPEPSPEEDDDVVQGDFFCDVCRQRFQETSLRDHVTSTVHQFSLKRDKQTSVNRFCIPPKNRGLKIMLKQGWDKESGLGPTNSGRLFPVKTVIRKPRTGLGTKQDPAKVTHFKAFDLRAVKYVPKPRAKNRNDIRREKHRDWKRERRLRKELS